MASPSTTAQAPASDEVAFLPPEHWARMAAEARDDGDADSVIDSKPESTASITSSIRQYRSIHGRTYHSEVGNAEYWGSNDDKQNEVIDILHHVDTLVLGDKLFLAPLKEDIQNIVDIGTGTGIWGIDVADRFPKARVVGTDISPIQPGWVPPNLEFQIDDCTREWTFQPDSLDYVHIRFMNGSIADWDGLFREAYRCLKPGGWVESSEPSPMLESDDGTVAPTSAWAQWGKIFIEGGRKNGRSFSVVKDGTQEKAMTKAGFKKLNISKYKVPLSPWPADPRQREIGHYLRHVFEQDMEGMVLYAATVLGDWSKEQVQVYMAQLRREVRSTKYHAYYRQKVVWAQKPEA